MKKTKMEREKEMVSYMIHYYCRKKHGSKTLCKSCAALLDYAYQRIQYCPFMETKTYCSACKIHCYKEEYRRQIKEVMRYSGPRMLWHHPIKALHHVYIERKEKRKK